MREIHPVIFHRPGPGSDHSLPMFEQDRLQAHIDHHRALQTGGLMAPGGPFMDTGSGGMMVAQPRLSMDKAQRLAAVDPCVPSGGLIVDVRPWFQALRT